MTKAAAATSRPVRKAEPQGTATKRTSKPRTVKVDPVTLVRQARDAYGTSKAALNSVEAAAVAYEQATSNTLGWVKVAQAVTLSARQFAAESGGDPNTLQRLRSVGDLLAASRKGKGARTLTVREATKIANAQPKRQIDALCADMLAGNDPLNTRQHKEGTGHRDGVQGGKRKAQPKAGKVTTVKPSDFPDVLGIVLANLHRCTADNLVEIARLAGEINTEATRLAAEKRAAKAA